MGDAFNIQGNWGQVGVLKAGFDVYDKDRNLIESRLWDSKSYTRWYARLVKSMFEFTDPTLTDINGTSFTAIMASDTTVQGIKLIKRYGRADNTTFGADYTGAMLAIGTGALTGEDSAFFNLKNNIAIQDARTSTSTITEDTTTIDYQIAEGITIINSAGETITEIGLFARIRQRAVGGGTPPFQVLMAYDEVNPGIFVPQGGIIAPKYTLSFPA